MKFYIIPLLEKPQAISLSKMSAELLISRGQTVILPASCSNFNFPDEVIFSEEASAFSEADAVVTVGGDGTILHAARTDVDYGKPILGINLGRTGFLATCEIEEIPQKLNALISGSYKIDERMLLEARIPGASDYCFFALNDIVLYLGNRKTTMDFTLFCDGFKINHYRGDGLIISTPTGSTAYSLSAGGPILDASVGGIIVTPICAHSLNCPPMVFSDKRTLSVQVHSTARDQVFICSDGFNEKIVPASGLVEIKKSSLSLKLISFNQEDQFKALDTKLNGR